MDVVEGGVALVGEGLVEEGGEPSRGNHEGWRDVG